MTNKNKVKTKVFGIPLSKEIAFGDDGLPLVKGKFTSDQKDMIGDIITKDATERAIGAYRQWGNIRYMHQPRPVGKVSRIGSDDGLEWNEVEIKVVDKEAAYQVEQGLLTALSVGISFGFDDFELLEDGGWQINDYTLAEISLVDHPANYDATLDLAALPETFRDKARAEGVYNAVKSLSLDDEQEDDVAEIEFAAKVEEEKDIEQEQAVEDEPVEAEKEAEVEEEKEVEAEEEKEVEAEEEKDVTAEEAVEEEELEVSAELEASADAEVEEIAETEEELDISDEETIEEDVTNKDLAVLIEKSTEAINRLAMSLELLIDGAQDEETVTAADPDIEDAEEDGEKSASAEIETADDTDNTPDRIAELEASNEKLSSEIAELRDTIEYLLSLPRERSAAVQTEEIITDDEDVTVEEESAPRDLRSSVKRHLQERRGVTVIRRRRS